jgi:hypothetical protein
MKKKIKITIIAVIVACVLYFSNILTAISSIISSYFTKVDDKYIIQHGEWLGEKKGIISLYDNTDSIANGMIYIQGKPLYKVKILNNYFNEITVLRLDNQTIDVFTSTEETTK